MAEGMGTNPERTAEEKEDADIEKIATELGMLSLDSLQAVLTKMGLKHEPLSTPVPMCGDCGDVKLLRKSRREMGICAQCELKSAKSDKGDKVCPECGKTKLTGRFVGIGKCAKCDKSTAK